MSRVKRNLAWLLVAQVSTWVMSISILLVGPRILGVETFGQLSFVIVYVSFFDLLATLGINTFLVKSISRDVDSVGRYTVNAIALKLVLALVLSGSAVALGVALDMTHTTLLLILAYCTGMTINAVGLTIVASLAGLQVMSGPARWNILQAYVGGLGALAVLAVHGSVVAYAFVLNLSFLVPIPANALKLRQYLGSYRRVDVRQWTALLRGGLPFFIGASVLVVYGTIDVPLLQAMAGPDRVGWYSLAYRWVSVPAFFAASVAGAFFPAMSAEGARVNAAFVALANRALRLAVLVATPATVGIALIASPFLSLLYDSDFEQSVPLLRILALHIPIVSLDIVLGAVAVAADRQRKWIIVSVAAMVFNPIVNLAAIPLTERLYSNGAIGAAVVTVLTELILMVGGIWLAPAGVLDRWMVNTIARIVLASGTMVPVVLLLRGTPLGVQVAAGAVSYALASLGLRTVSVDEVRRLLHSVLRRRPRQAEGAGG